MDQIEMSKRLEEIFTFPLTLNMDCSSVESIKQFFLTGEKFPVIKDPEVDFTSPYLQHDIWQFLSEIAVSADICKEIDSKLVFYIQRIVIQSLIFGKNFGMMTCAQYMREPGEYEGLLDSLLNNEATIKKASAMQGAKKGNNTRDAALSFMKELMREDPDIKQYQLAKQTHADSKKHPKKYSRKTAIPLSTCHDYSVIAKAGK